MTKAFGSWGERWIARCDAMWEWFDRRRIDAHIVAFAILYMTIHLGFWTMGFVERHCSDARVELAAIIGAIWLPWAGLQAAAIKFVLEHRRSANNGGI